MKTFTYQKVWIENEGDEVANGHYECKEHGEEDCKYCSDVAIEKPLNWGIAGRKSPLDEVMERLIGGKK